MHYVSYTYLTIEAYGDDYLELKKWDLCYEVRISLNRLVKGTGLLAKYLSGYPQKQLLGSQNAVFIHLTLEGNGN